MYTTGLIADLKILDVVFSAVFLLWKVYSQVVELGHETSLEGSTPHP